MTETQTYDRELYMKNWAEKILKCENNAFAIAAALINQAKNFQTATAVLFGLSFRTHKEYIIACAEYWKVNFPDNAVADADYCLQFQQHYIADVMPYPENA